MKKLFISFVASIALITGCTQDASGSLEDITKLAYKWEKAKFDNDYEKQQEIKNLQFGCLFYRGTANKTRIV